MNSKTEDFIKTANQIHDNKYDYSKVIYINAKTKVIITCKKHGDFEQQAGSHTSTTQPRGCSKCAYDLKKPSLETFITSAKEVHGDLYDYSKVVYVKNTEPVIIICKKHGEFLQKPNHHVSSKAGCKNCTMNILTKDEFLVKIKNIHGDKYTYEDSIIKSYRDEIIINCKKHGKFNQILRNHLDGSGCISCGVESMSIKKKI
jgi:hypothetical protein